MIYLELMKFCSVTSFIKSYRSCYFEFFKRPRFCWNYPENENFKPSASLRRAKFCRHLSHLKRPIYKMFILRVRNTNARVSNVFAIILHDFYKTIILYIVFSSQKYKTFVVKTFFRPIFTLTRLLSWRLLKCVVCVCCEHPIYIFFTLYIADWLIYFLIQIWKSTFGNGIVSPGLSWAVPLTRRHLK